MCEDYNPTDNGIAERVNGILKTEWLCQLPLLTDIGDAMVQMAHIIDLYNFVRPHWSLQQRTPMAVYQDDPTITPAERWYNIRDGKEVEKADG